MLQYALHPAIMQDLKAHLHGELICPYDHGYDAARKVWNGMIDKYPAAIVRCADVADVVTPVQFARDLHLRDPVRSVGHTVSCRSVCDGGLAFDLLRLKGLWAQ